MNWIEEKLQDIQDYYKMRKQYKTDRRKRKEQIIMNALKYHIREGAKCNKCKYLYLDDLNIWCCRISKKVLSGTQKENCPYFKQRKEDLL